MKKLFIVLAVASLGFVACNNEAETDTVNEDSLAKVAKDSADAAKAAIENTSDSLKNNIDSLTEQKVDSLKK